ncbi:MAG: hypothetical protein J6Y08_07435 [Clostridiales bacterium]|nr:hypothetical protein [Clostridiales bacterium]
MTQKTLLQTIRKNNIRIRLLVGIILLVFAGLVSLGCIDEISYFTASKNVFAEPCTSYQVEKFYRAKTCYIYDWFAENKDGRFYLAPVENAQGDANYLIIYLPNSYQVEADRIMAQTHDYLDSGDESLLKANISGRGYVTTINPKTLQYLDEYCEQAKLPASVRNRVCDEMFVMVSPWKVLLDGNGFMLLVVLVLVCCAVGSLISLLFVSSNKGLKKALAPHGMTPEMLDREFSSPELIEGDIWINKDYIFRAAGPFRLIPIKHVVWIYPGKTNNINSAPIYRSIFLTRHRECIQFDFKTEDAAERVCRMVASLAPRALYGYVIENSDMYYNHFDKLIDLVYNQDDPEATKQAEKPKDPEAPVSADTFLTSTPDAANEGTKENTTDISHEYNGEQDILKPGI